MTELHTRPYRYPTYQTASRVKNWHEYEQSRRDRGDITLWISPDALSDWRAPMTGTRGAQPMYADIAIETARTLRLLCHLPLRQTEGFLGSVLRLMDVSLPCPDHTTLSRRHATVLSKQQVDHVPPGPIDVLVDRTGLQVYGQGTWHRQEHGEKQARRWKTLHIGVHAQGRIVASTVTESHAQDPSQVPERLSQVNGVLDRFIGEGIVDHAPMYRAIEHHAPGARVIIPPRKDAVLRATASPAPT